MEELEVTSNIDYKYSLLVFCHKIPKPQIKSNNLHKLCTNFMLFPLFTMKFCNCTLRIWFTIHLDYNPLILAIDEVITLILLFLYKINQYWHYLICYKLSFNLHRNNIQLHGLMKYVMLITYILEFLNFHWNKVHKKNYTIHNHA
jgi:hypothetical protein